MKIRICICYNKPTSEIRTQSRVKRFGEDWEHFKLLFHREDACREAARLLKELTVPEE